MGLVTFGQSSSDKSSIITRLKFKAFPNRQNPTSHIPVVRVGNSNYFQLTQSGTYPTSSGTTVSLYSTALVATYVCTSSLVSSTITAMHLSSDDQCLYMVITAATTHQLVKMNDVTGVVTLIGGTYTPAAGVGGLMVVEGSALKVFGGVSGTYYTINKTTGAIVTDSVVPSKTGYVSLDGTISSSLIMTSNPQGAVYGEYMNTPSCNSDLYGNVPVLRFHHRDVFGHGSYATVGQDGGVQQLNFMFVDSDTLCFWSWASYNQYPIRLVKRSDYDAFIKSIANFWGGA